MFSISKRSKLVILLVLINSLLVLPVAMALQPDGASTTQIETSKTNSSHVATTHDAFAGNVTELAVYGLSPTQAWQGYYGNVTGTIVLSDANNNVMYNWSVASPQGEIYATTNNTINWVYTMCFNFTADGTGVDDTAQAGGTSLYGINVSTLETRFNIIDSNTFNNSVDGVNETFTQVGGDQFYVANLQFDTGECQRTHVYGPTGPTSNIFQQSLLWEPTSGSLIFATILENNANKFNGGTADFEMLVLEDGHGTNLAPTTYYFFVELE